MDLKKAEIQTFSKKDIQYIKTYFRQPIDIGSEVSCYRLSSKQVIKIFDMNPTDLSTKLFIPNEIYGSNTFIFVDAIQKYCNKIFSYTMKYIKGVRLGKIESIKIFYDLTYNMLLDYITTLLTDCKTLSNYGIEAFDCFENNIILANEGFKQIDCVDFSQQDKDPTIIEKENIRLMCQTIWDSLIAPQLSTFISNNNLKPGDFTSSPYEFIKELKNISQQYSDTEIITLNDTKKLSRRK